jgi:hypothetical protein
MEAVIELDKQREEAGWEILSLSDRLGLGAQAAFWLYSEDASRWQYYLITPLVDEKGPRWIYERLLKVFQKTKLPPGIKPLDIFVFTPAWDVFQGMFNMEDSEMSDERHTSKISNIAIENFYIKYSVIYRLNKDGKARANYFDMKVRKLLTA